MRLQGMSCEVSVVAGDAEGHHGEPFLPSSIPSAQPTVTQRGRS